MYEYITLFSRMLQTKFPKLVTILIGIWIKERRRYMHVHITDDMHVKIYPSKRG